MGICEYVRGLLLECPLFEGEVVSVGFFDERLGGAMVCELDGKNVVRNYTDGGRLVEESVKIVFSHVGGRGNAAEADARNQADEICRWFDEITAVGMPGEFNLNEVISIECSVGKVVGAVGAQRREIICKVRYLERKGEK